MLCIQPLDCPLTPCTLLPPTLIALCKSGVNLILPLASMHTLVSTVWHRFPYSVISLFGWATWMLRKEQHEKCYIRVTAYSYTLGVSWSNSTLSFSNNGSMPPARWLCLSHLYMTEWSYLDPLFDLVITVSHQPTTQSLRFSDHWKVVCMRLHR